MQFFSSLLRRKKILIFFFATFIFSFYGILFYKITHPNLPSPKNPIILYSNQCKHDLKKHILKALQTSTDSIHMVMFGLTDKEILKELTKKDKIADVNIFYDKRSSGNINLTNATAIKKSGLMHQKIIIVDQKAVYLGSTNLTKSSLCMHNNLVVGIYSPEIATFLINNTPFYKNSHLKTIVNNQDLELFLLPDKQNEALNKLIEIISSAQKTIKIAMFTLTHPSLLDKIIEAKKRNVKISIITDYRSALGAGRKAIKKLRNENIEIQISQGIELLHHKYLYVDEKILACGSANWTKAAFQKNIDLLLTISPLTTDQVKFMNKLHKIIEYQTH